MEPMDAEMCIVGISVADNPSATSAIPSYLFGSADRAVGPGAEESSQAVAGEGGHATSCDHRRGDLCGTAEGMPGDGGREQSKQEPEEGVTAELAEGRLELITKEAASPRRRLSRGSGRWCGVLGAVVGAAATAASPPPISPSRRCRC